MIHVDVWYKVTLTLWLWAAEGPAHRLAPTPSSVHNLSPSLSHLSPSLFHQPLSPLFPHRPSPPPTLLVLQHLLRGSTVSPCGWCWYCRPSTNKPSGLQRWRPGGQRSATSGQSEGQHGPVGCGRCCGDGPEADEARPVHHLGSIPSLWTPSAAHHPLHWQLLPGNRALVVPVSRPIQPMSWYHSGGRELPGKGLVESRHSRMKHQSNPTQRFSHQWQQRREAGTWRQEKITLTYIYKGSNTHARTYMHNSNCFGSGEHSPVSCSILQAAGDHTEHTALVVKHFPQQINVTSDFTDREQSKEMGS